ncbi:hypothetical protein ACFYRC_38175 [Streptomyces sp. NPDC005279]|uniref:hypothetical protein n=1 Tax=Streptomyces sp. NPDC005279 TaxID=3364712 RepID=UPI003675FA5F
MPHSGIGGRGRLPHRHRTTAEINALYRLRAAQGILGLRKKYGETRLEAACAKAIAVGDPSYRTIKGILVAGTETDPEPEPETSGDAGAAAFLHGPQQLFARSARPDGTRRSSRLSRGRPAGSTR